MRVERAWGWQGKVLMGRMGFVGCVLLVLWMCVRRALSGCWRVFGCGDVGMGWGCGEWVWVLGVCDLVGEMF